MTAPSRRDEIELRRIWSAARRNFVLVAIILVVALVAGGAYAMLAPRVFETEAVVLITDKPSDLDGLGSLLPSRLGLAAGLGRNNAIQTDMAVLRSRQVVEMVVDSLALHVRLIEGASARDSVLQVLSSPRLEGGGRFTLDRQSDGSYSVSAETAYPALAVVPARVRPGEPFHVGPVRLSLHASLPSPQPQRIRFAVDPFRTAVASVQSRVGIAQPVLGAQLVSVTFRDSDPVVAAAVPNALTTHFIRYKREVHTVNSVSTIRFLEEQAGDYAAKLARAEEDLQRFREQARIVEPRSQATEQVRRLAEMQARRDGLETEARSLRALLARVTSSAGTSGTGPSPYRDLAAYPTFISNQGVQGILQSLIQLETERSELLVRRTDRSVDVLGINERVRELENQLYDLATNYLAGLDHQITGADGSLSQFTGTLAQVPAREVEYYRLARESKLLEEVYTLVQTRLKEAQIGAASDDVNVRMVDQALVPLVPASPRRPLILSFALALGLAFSVIAVMTREFMDRRVRGQDDVVAAVGGMPVLMTIPRTPAPRRLGLGTNGSRRTLRNGTAEAHLITRDDPWSPAAEAYRSLRSDLLLFEPEVRPQVVLLTSTAPDDGKTTTAANLAVAFAQQGKKTLLIDADLRRGTIHRLFGLERAPGLADLLSGVESQSWPVHRTVLDGGHGLDLLTCGSATQRPAELLGSDAVPRLLQTAREQYEVVVIDTPPINLVADASTMAHLADAVLLVARERHTNREALEEAARRLQQIGVGMRGVVVNDVETVTGLASYTPELVGSGSPGR